MKDRIVARRKQLRWERKEAAHNIDIDYQYLYKLEKGQNVPPTWELLVKLANGLQTSVDYILELTNDPTPAAERGEWTPEAIAAGARGTVYRAQVCQAGGNGYQSGASRCQRG